MNLTHPLGSVSAPLGATALTAAASSLVGLAALATRALKKRREHDTWTAGTAGCKPDHSAYLDYRVCVHEVDGSHQGLAISMLRDRLLPTPAAPLPPELAGLDSGALVQDLNYDDALRSCIEVCLNLALEMAEAECETECLCGEADCDAAGYDYETLHLVAAQKMTEFALTFEAKARQHAHDCHPCTEAGDQAPALLRARFCRDIADDLLTNFESDDTVLRGVPIPAAVDVLVVMAQTIEGGYDTPVSMQIDRLATGLASAIAHQEAHRAQQA